MSINPGLYRIKNVQSGTYFDASLQHRGEIHGWSNRDGQNQKWRVESNGSGLYTLKNAETGQYASGHEQDGTPVRASDQPAEWEIKQDGEGYAIHLRNSRYVIDLDNGQRNDGAKINIWARDRRHNQQLWHFEPVGGGGGGYNQGQGQQQQQSYGGGYQGPVPPGAYHIVNVKAGTRLDLAGGETNEGTPVLGWHGGSGQNQIWHLEPGQNGYRLRNHAAGTYASFNDNPSQGLAISGSRQSREWKLVGPTQNGGYKLQVADNTGYVLDLAGGESKDGAKILVWENGSGLNQEWRFEPAQV